MSNLFRWRVQGLLILQPATRGECFGVTFQDLSGTLDVNMNWMVVWSQVALPTLPLRSSHHLWMKVRSTGGSELCKKSRMSLSSFMHAHAHFGQSGTSFVWFHERWSLIHSLVVVRESLSLEGKRIHFHEDLPICIERCDGLCSIWVQRLRLLQQDTLHQSCDINVDVAAEALQTCNICLNPSQQVRGSGDFVSALVIIGHLYNNPVNLYSLVRSNAEWTKQCMINDL